MCVQIATSLWHRASTAGKWTGVCCFCGHCRVKNVSFFDYVHCRRKLRRPRGKLWCPKRWPELNGKETMFNRNKELTASLGESDFLVLDRWKNEIRLCLHTETSLLYMDLVEISISCTEIEFFYSYACSFLINVCVRLLETYTRRTIQPPFYLF